LGAGSGVGIDDTGVLNVMYWTMGVFFVVSVP